MIGWRLGPWPTARREARQTPRPRARLVHAGVAQLLEMRHERRPHACRQHRDSIDPRFSIADADLATIEVDVLDAQGQGLEQSQPRPVQQLADEPHRTMQWTQDRRHLTLRQHDRQPDWTVRPLSVAPHSGDRSSTFRYRKSTAHNAWFCVDALIRLARASIVTKAST